MKTSITNKKIHLQMSCKRSYRNMGLEPPMSDCTIEHLCGNDKKKWRISWIIMQIKKAKMEQISHKFLSFLKIYYEITNTLLP